MLSGARISLTRPTGRVFAFRVRQRGYTIVELVVVLLLMGLLAANAMPQFFNASRFEAMGFADASAASARFAQRLAISSGCDTLFRVDGSGYGIFQRASDCATGALTRAVSRPGGQAWAQPAPAGVTVGSLAVYFDGEGRPYDQATDTQITSVVSFAVGSRTITLQPQTGFVQVQ